ncbi:FKBP-type peptidyl-prolyl cis-trans isomerase [Pseudokineococcus basanitobsidens]|uniref:peptidylprolyl isomerase n=1 Tax=Pseudokineococcus basanitobsidens TaxID=1926649 RepID=A0ABU8RIQ9_9ACTN
MRLLRHPWRHPGGPRPRRASRALAAAILPALLVAGCGAGEADPAPDDPLDGVEVVSDGGDGEAPELELETPVTVAQTTSEVVTEGDGRVVDEGDLVALDVLAVDGGDGSVLSSTYEGATRLTLLADPATTVPGLLDGVVGRTVGSRVLVAVSPEDFPNARGQAQGGTASPTPTVGDGSVVLLVDLEDAQAVPERAEGAQLPAPEGLPEVTPGDDGAPTIAAPQGDPPGELRVEPLLQGDADDVVEEGDTVAVKYTGVLWSTGSVFDSSWTDDRPPFVFTLGAGQVIPAWDSGLVGTAVGSRQLVVAPPDQAYGDQENGAIPGGSTLVFVVDVLASVPATR